MIKRRDLVIALGAGALAPLASLAQQAPGKVWRIGFLCSESATAYARRIDDLRAGLADYGYVEGKNLVIEWRWADGKDERLDELAADLVRIKADVIVSHAGNPVLAAKRATASIPIVIGASGDAVAMGLVASLAKPGGNVTGSTFFNTELMAKRLEIIKDVLPRLTHAAVLLHPDARLSPVIHQAMVPAAKSLKLALHRFDVRNPEELDGAFAAMAKQRIGAVVVFEHPKFNANVKKILALAAQHRIAVIGNGDLAEAGGLIGYGANFSTMYRRAGYFVDRILKGTKPADLPVEQPTNFEIVVNLKTAKALGLKVPETILIQATKVIE